MNANERFIFRLKKPILASEIRSLLDNPSTSKIFEFLTIKNELPLNCVGDRASKIIDLTLKIPDERAIEMFWNVLKEYLPETYNELQQELAAEDQSLHVDSQIRHESHYATQKYFGSAKNFPEREKTKIEKFVAFRTQAVKNTWIFKCERIRNRLTEAEKLVDNCDDTIGSLVLYLDEKLDRQKRKLLKFLPADKQMRVKSVMMRCNGEYPSSRKMSWKRLEVVINKQNTLLDFCITFSEEIIKSRNSALKILKIKHDDSDYVDLDKELTEILNYNSAIIKKLQESLVAEKEKLNKKDQEIKKLKNELKALLIEKDQDMIAMASNLQKVREISMKYEKELGNTKQKLMQTKNELDRRVCALDETSSQASFTRPHRLKPLKNE